MSGCNLVVIGLTLSSSWGNGHATTYRALLRAMAARGASVTFLECDVSWYRQNRDMPRPDFARLELYESVADLRSRFDRTVREADAVIVGSYVRDGVAVIDWTVRTARGPVAFYDIDTPVTLARLVGHDEQYLAPRQIPDFHIYLSFSGGTVLDLLKTRYGAREAAALYCTVDMDHYRPDAARSERWRMGYLGTYSDDRQPMLDRLLLEPARRLPEDAFVVAGPQYPESVAWPANVERIDHLPPAGHPDFYNAQGFALNVTRRDMVTAGWSPSVRLFEAAACATPVISDPWDGLGQIFPTGEALLVAETTDHVLAHLDLPEQKRRAIGEAAREVVYKRHRAEIRAAELESFLLDARARQDTAA